MTSLTARDLLHPIRACVGTWHAADAAARRDWPTALYVYAVAAVCLVLSDLNYLGGQEAADAFLAWLAPPQSAPWERYFELWRLGYWAGVKIVAYLVIPALAVWAHPRLSFADLGVVPVRSGASVGALALLFAPVAAAIAAVSFSQAFLDYYPFYSHSTRSPLDFWLWEALYLGQFFALEFFFRGFLLHPVARSAGSAALFASVIPYVMIHFGKPITECFAAVGAGIVLGTVALRTRSIWPGFALHAAVAVSMDTAANLHKFGVQWIPRILGL